MLSDHILGNFTKVDENEIFVLKFHPTEQILLSGDISGAIHFNLFDTDSHTVTLPEGMGETPFKPHKNSTCRSIDLVSSSAGYDIVSGGSDGRVIVSNFDPKVTGKWKISDSPINVVSAISENMVVAGDDDGGIHAIDLRERKKVFSLHEQTDYISAITSSVSGSPHKSIIALSGDCTLAVYDFRGVAKDRLVAMSDEQEEELNCVAVINSEQNVITGDAHGVVGIWKQGYWGDLKDRLPLYLKSENVGADGAHSIDGMKVVGDKKFVSVTSDGIIRMCSLFPNQVDRVIGVHQGPDDREIATISGFDCDIDTGVIATACGDAAGTIKFWSLNGNTKTAVDDESEDEEEVSKKSSKKKRKTGTKSVVHTNPEKAKKQSFFSDL